MFALYAPAPVFRVIDVTHPVIIDLTQEEVIAISDSEEGGLLVLQPLQAMPLLSHHRLKRLLLHSPRRPMPLLCYRTWPSLQGFAWTNRH